MDKPITFDEVFKDAYDYWIDDADIHRYEGAKGLAGQVWQHQQAKVEELQKQLIDQGQRFNEQAQVVKDLEHKNGELQKRVDKALQEIKGAARWINEDAIDDPDFIKGGALTALRRLEQALKGEGNA